MGMKTGFARTCAGAQGRLQVLTPAEDCGIQHRIDHRKRGVVVQVKTVAVALAASVVTVLWFVIAVHRLATKHLANPTGSPSGQAIPALWSADAALAVLRSLALT